MTEEYKGVLVLLGFELLMLPFQLALIGSWFKR
jgi:hypothetical protein